MERKNPQFLKERFPKLASSPEVRTTGGVMVQKTHQAFPASLKEPGAAEQRIQLYLDRFNEIVHRSDPRKKERGINTLKAILIEQNVVRVEDIPGSYWQAQMKVVRSRGQAGDWAGLSPEQVLHIKQEHLHQTKEDQQGSLEEWVDYLFSERSNDLPDYLKYWAFQGMLQLERYTKGDKEKGEVGKFPQRPTGRNRSVKMFPEVNDRALKFIAQSLIAQEQGQEITFGRYDIPKEAQHEFLAQLKQKNFRELYGWGQEYMPPISAQELQTTQGEWKTYTKGSAAKELTTTLQGKGSGWCIAGEQVAQGYLNKGNVYVYYTYDRNNALTIPRVVIVEEEGKVTEVRGIEWQENVDIDIKASTIIAEKLNKVPGGNEFIPTDQDTKLLTAIDTKIAKKESLEKSELDFLYEINRPIKYFGRKKDPRIQELRNKRNVEQDMLVIFDCTTEQIAHSQTEVTANTKAYVGPLYSGIFTQLRHLDHIYTQFPEKKMRRTKVEIGGKTREKLTAEFEANNIQTWGWTKQLMKKMAISTERTTVEIVKLTIADLGFPNGCTTTQLFQRAIELGLEFCPAELGPHYRLHYMDQPENEWLSIGMEPITDLSSRPSVFFLDHSGGRLGLHAGSAGPGRRWLANVEIAFSLCKVDAVAA